MKDILKCVLQKVNPKKATVPDDITGIMVKELPPIAIKYLIQLSNRIIQVGYFPGRWKISLVAMIPQADKDLTLARSYQSVYCT